MSSDETQKIEPTLIVNDAPPIAAVDQPPAIDAMAEVEARTAEAKIEPKIEPRIEQVAKIEPTIEAEAEPKIEPHIEAKIEAPTLPPAPQLHEPPAAVIPFNRPEPKPEAPAGSGRSRFALLAACVAIAASVGAIGGSLGVAKFGPMLASAPPPAAPATRDHVADEVKALKDALAQLRGVTKSLSDNLAALKTSVTISNTAQNAQIGKIAETLDRVEKAQAEQKKTIAAVQSAPETTGSVPQKLASQSTPVPMVLGDPPTTLKPPILQDFVLRRVYDGAALIEGRNGVIEVETGETVPGLGRIEAIKRQDGRWVVVTARGLVVQR